MNGNIDVIPQEKIRREMVHLGDRLGNITFDACRFHLFELESKNNSTHGPDHTTMSPPDKYNIQSNSDEKCFHFVRKKMDKTNLRKLNKI